MDVDSDNFEEAYSLLETHLQKASYVAIDLEMTGILFPPDVRTSAGDVPQVRYNKYRLVVDRPLNIVQVGICLYEPSENGQFFCRPFNFFVYPRTFSEVGSDGKQVKSDDTFMGMSGPAMEFLRKHGIDINRWIDKGVPYVNAATEEALLKIMPIDSPATIAGMNGNGNGENSEKAREKPKAEKPEDVELIKDAMEKVATFATSTECEMMLPDCNSFLALILRNEINDQYPRLVVEKRPHPTNSRFQQRWVMNISPQGMIDRGAETKKRIWSHIGFRRVWNLLKKVARPIILHNGVFDLMFLYSHFERRLPHTLETFKSEIHRTFPNIFDTKVVAELADSAASLKTRSTLDSLTEALDAKLKEATDKQSDSEKVGDASTENDVIDVEGLPRFSCPVGFDAYTASSSTFFHNAGYDAFQTGRVFGYFKTAMGDNQTLSYNNRIYLINSAFSLCMDRHDDLLVSDGVGRYLYDVDPSALPYKSIQELVKPLTDAGKRKCSIRWCGQKSMLLIIHGKDVAEGGANRSACEQCLVAMLDQQVAQGRLKYSNIQEHVDHVGVEAAVKDGQFGGKVGQKRPRQE